jgi:type IV pilus assembly protein PilW
MSTMSEFHKRMRKGQGGFSLVELMVSMVIGLLVLGAAFGIFLSNNRAFSATQGLGRIQENSQAAFEMMARDIREAGGNPCDVELPAGNIIAGGTAATATSANWFLAWNQPLYGYEGSGLASQVAGTDAVQVLRLDQGVRTLTTALATAGTTTLTYTPAEPQFNAGDTIMVCDMRVLGIFRAAGNSGVSGTTGTVSFSGGGNQCSYFPQPNAAPCAGTATAYLFPKFSTVSRLQGVRWFVCDPDSDPVNGDSLCRQVNGGAVEEVVPGVQDMQIQYLTDAGYVAANALSTVADWNRVRAVRISLTMQETDPGNSAAGGSTDGAPIARTFDHIVSLRNRNL